MKQLLCVVLTLGWASAASALDPNTSDPAKIMEAVFERPFGDRGLSRMKMTIRADGTSRERVMRLRRQRFEEGTKLLIQLEGPAEVRSTGFLSVDYKNPDKADEQWMYLPKLHRVTRIPDSDRSAPFLGSDFSYADLSEQNPKEYKLKLLEQSVEVDGEPCWLIEATPATAHAKQQTGYQKTQVWISKSKLLPLQIKAWVNKGKRIKYLKSADFRRVGEIWTPHRVQARTIRGDKLESETTIEVLSVKYHADEVTDADFTQQRLESGL